MFLKMLLRLNLVVALRENGVNKLNVTFTGIINKSVYLILLQLLDKNIVVLIVV